MFDKAKVWHEMVRKSFHPSQWWERDDNQDCPDHGGLAMWVYHADAGAWIVGYYDPRAIFHQESIWPTAEQAANRVHYLNGGKR